MSLEGDICVVCCQDIKYYATGSCDHTVCFECSTRMRVLCEQNECPICRNDMPLVIFTHHKTLFSDAPKFLCCNEKYNISFEDEEIKEAFMDLLQYVCPVCGSDFETFDNLKAHVRLNHTLFYCDLCVKNLKIFPYERKCYSRSELARHKRKGDPDNTSHRGHPLCELCDERFLDYDELFRHSRREHYFCHFCDADGFKNTFYPDYSYLKTHFRKIHYLCEEGDCSKEQFVGAFRSEIDYKAHIALNHSKHKTKAEVKQTRTLDFEFPFAPRNSASGNSSPNSNEFRHNRHGPHNSRREQIDQRSDAVDEVQISKQSQNKAFNTQCDQDFPHLVDGSVPEQFREGSCYSNCISNDRHVVRKHVKPVSSQSKIQIEDFPSLSSAVSKQRNQKLPRSNLGVSLQNVGSTSDSSTKTDSVHKAIKWGKPLRENGSEKVTHDSAHWSATPKIRSIDEEFPKLETKGKFTHNATAQPPGRWKKQMVDVDPKELASELRQKCKLKKKQKVETINVKKVPLSNQNEPRPLSKLYTGFTNYDVLGMEKDENSSKVLNVKIYDKMEKYRKEAEDDDIWRDKVCLVEEDFPPLAPLPPPPTLAKVTCPPGFQASNTPKVTAAAPPGFSNKTNNIVSLSSIAQQLADAKEPNALYSYQQPFDFQTRNALLTQQIFKFVNSDNKLFEEFKSLSGNFRKSKIVASEYYSSCMLLFGKEKFFQLFAELLCLLPDITKQQELLTVHSNFLKQESNKGAISKHKGYRTDSIASLIVCQTCNQVLIKSDFDTHANMHENNSG